MVRKKHSRSASWCHNFTLRFVYEFFLILCICSMLQLSVEDFNVTSPTLQYALAVILTVMISALVVLTIALFFCGGPWIPKFFRKWTIFASLYRIRPRSPDFDGA